MSPNWRFWRRERENPRKSLVSLGTVGGGAFLVASSSGDSQASVSSRPVSVLSVREAMGLREDALDTSKAVRLMSKVAGAKYPEDYGEYQNYLDAYRYVPYVARAVDIKTYYAFQAGYDLEGDEEDVKQASEQLAKLNADTILREATTWVQVFGNHYWRVIRQDSEPKIKLSPLNPLGVGIELKDTGEVEDYAYKASATSKAEKIRPEEILHLRLDSEPWQAFGYGLLRRVIITIKQILFMEEKLPLIARRRADPWLEFQLGSLERPLEEGEFNRIKASILNRASGEDLFHDGTVQIREIYQAANVGGRQTIDPLIQNFKNNLIAGLGVPEVYLGMGSTTLKGTAEHQEKGFESEIRGIQRQLKRFQEQQLFPLLGIDSGVRIVWRPLKPEDRALLSQQLMSEIEHSVVTPEYARTRLGYPEGKEMAGDFLASTSLISQTAAAQQADKDKAKADLTKKLLSGGI